MKRINTISEKVVPLILLAIYLIFHERYALLGAVFLTAVIDLSKFIKNKVLYEYLITGLLFMVLGVSIITGGQDFILKPFTVVMLMFVLIWKFIVLEIIKKKKTNLS